MYVNFEETREKAERKKGFGAHQIDEKLEKEESGERKQVA